MSDATAVKATDAATDAVKTKAGIMVESVKSSWIIILIVVAMFILVLIVIYIISIVKKNKLQNVSLQTNMLSLNNREIIPYKVSSENLTLVANGQEFSYAFWIILNSTYDSTSDHKLILQRGGANNIVAGRLNFSSSVNPVILMDKATNKMYVCISTTKVTKSNFADNILAKDSGYIVSTIDYLPLQRWVFIGVVIRETTLYVFIDGDLYSATSIYDIPTANGSRPMIKGTNGDIIIGEKNNTTQGYLANSRYFNYALTQKEMTSYYNSGPSKGGIMSMLGLDNYGVRSPIYEVGSK